MRRLVFACLVSAFLVAGGGCFESEEEGDNGAADVSGDLAAVDDTATPMDTATAQDAFTNVTADSDTCKLIATPAEMNDYLTSDLTTGTTWAWLATVQETGAYDVDTSTQLYALCAEVFRCQSGSWGQLEIMIFKAVEAPPWLNAVRGATTQLVGVGDEAWEYPLQTAVVAWVGDYAMYLGARSGFTKSWTQQEIDAYAPIVVDLWTKL